MTTIPEQPIDINIFTPHIIATVVLPNLPRENYKENILMWNALCSIGNMYCYNGNREIVKMLLDANADPDILNLYNVPASTITLHNNHYDIVQLFITKFKNF
jgi:hypothetical protein